eukprot:SAG31_NODE_12708_length_922_cov_1.252734_1_plen_283_part_00
MISQECPELDLILGGHDHDAYRAVVNGVPLIKSGTDFRELTAVTVKLDRAGGKPNVNWKVQELTGDLVEDGKASAMVHDLTDNLAVSMEKVIGEIGVELDTRFAKIRTQETNASNWIADCIRDGTGADITILNSGTLRADELIPPGPFRAKDLVTLLPMLDELSVLGLTGAQLLEALENGVSQYPKLEGRFPCLAGLRLTFDASKPGGSRIDPATVSIKQRGTTDFMPLDMEKEYSVATKAYLALGKDGYDVFTKARLIADSGENLFELQANLLRLDTRDEF